MSIEVFATVELIKDSDGTFGARWDGVADQGATWDHPTLDGVFLELLQMVQAPESLDA